MKNDIEIMEQFDADGVGIANGNYFGMPFTADDSRLVLVSVPWDVTSSYGGGASSAPDAIIEASTQLDFYDSYAPQAWRAGIATEEIDYSIQESSVQLRDDAVKIMEHLETGGITADNFILSRKLDRINEASRQVNSAVYETVRRHLSAGRRVGVVGGDHSVPYGAIRALSQFEEHFGILHLDAHMDLRECYEGFEFSHASIMYNVLRDIPQVDRIVQVGVRDFSQSELDFAVRSGRVTVFSDADMCEAEFCGESWEVQCARIVGALPDKVYVSFDIDALEAAYCPNTGTPVPGGLSFAKAAYLLRRTVDSGRRIVGFDLCEVAPAADNTWDANVGARVLFGLCGQVLRK